MDQEFKRFVDVALPLPLRQVFTYGLPDDLEAEPGHEVEVPFGRRIMKGWIVAQGDSSDAPGIKAVQKVKPGPPLFIPDYLSLARWVADFYFSSLGEALAAMLPGTVRTRGSDNDTEMVVSDGIPVEAAPGFSLHPQQVSALETLGRIDSGLAYLQGVTGSGKTEVFLRHAEAVISRGKQVIYLVPEISLTGQVVEAIQARFQQKAAILHSRLSAGQRLKEWRRILDGKAMMVVGPRSAVFAPVRDLGLIILDEEHETAYKSQSAPRYHARQVAMHRAAQSGSLLLMGSATPSVEAWHLMEKGLITRISLPQRISGGPLPTLILSRAPGSTSIGPDLVEEIQKTWAMGAQTILFLNRRGFSHFAFCAACGDEVKCRHCSVPMTFHKSRDRLVCHYCGRSQGVPKTCPSCRTGTLSFAGFGTEFIEEETRKLFPFMEISRIDTDSTSRKGELDHWLTRFRQGDTHLMLGTQMIAKGLNFPGLRLVGVILGDGSLHVPDFRAAERTFQLLTQVAGRAGRFRDDGIVLIQAAQPEHPVLQWVANHDQATFYTRELEQRREQGFPPFTRLFRLVFRSRVQEKTVQAARAFLPLLEPLRSFVDIMGPAECPIGQLNGSWRHHMILTTRDFPRLHRALGEILAVYRNEAAVHLEVDVDAVSLM